METRTKWIIGISTAIGLGVTAFLTKQYWMPLFTKKSLNVNVDEPRVITKEENSIAIQAKAKGTPLRKPLTRVEAKAK